MGGSIIYEPGDRVVIVSERPQENWNGKMDVWLGKAMTVRRREPDSFAGSPYYRMEEDEGRWTWGDFMIAGLFHEELEDFKIATDEEFFTLFN